MDKDLGDVITDILRAVLILIMLFVVYQVLIVILGGTWETENIIIDGNH